MYYFQISYVKILVSLVDDIYFRTLSKFDVGLMPLKVIPEEYRRDVELPVKYANTSNPENVLPYVPGNLFFYCDSSE